jgi:hypothetical protein
MKVSGEVTKNIFSLHFLQDKKLKQQATRSKFTQAVSTVQSNIKQAKVIDEIAK